MPSTWTRAPEGCELICTLEDVPVNKVEQFVKLQQMPVSSSIFFVGCILVGVGVHSLRVKSIGNHTIQSQGVGHLEGHPKNSWFFGGCRFAAAIQDE